MAVATTIIVTLVFIACIPPTLGTIQRINNYYKKKQYEKECNRLYEELVGEEYTL